jgi:hypothetical protein
MASIGALSADRGRQRDATGAPADRLGHDHGVTLHEPVDDERIALNESRFREVNEGIEEGRREREGLVPFVCECGLLGCNAVVEVTLREYEEVRSGSRCFLVAPGHGASFDELRREEGRFDVVRKPDGPLGELADRTDPRREPA